MKPVYQTRYGEPHGNCFAACVASILECGLADLPDLDNLPEGRNWLDWFNEQLAERGLSSTIYLYQICFFPCTEEQPLTGYVPSGTHIITNGKNKEGIAHSQVAVCEMVVFENEVRERKWIMVHDPHLNGSAVDEIDSVCLVIRK